MPARNSPLSLNQRVIDIGNELRRLRAGMTAGGGFDPNADPVVIGLSANGHAHAGSVAVGSHAQTGAVDAVAIGHSVTANGTLSVAIGHSVTAPAYTTVVGSDAITPGTECTTLGYGANSGAYSDANYNTAVGAWSTIDVGGGHLQLCTAVGHSSKVVGQHGTALGAVANARYPYSVAVGAYAVTTVDHQIMLGTDAEFVEIPGSGTMNGLVLTDTADGTRYLVQITSGALVLSTAP